MASKKKNKKKTTKKNKTAKKKSSKSTKKKTKASAKKKQVAKLTGIPNSRVEEVEATIKASPNYIDHIVIPEDDKHSTIIATFEA